MILPSTSENITKAAALLREGKLVSFPTETVYGLGANALDASAIEKIYALKGRPSSNPLIVHVESIDRISNVADLESNPFLIENLKKLSKFWPGPLSVVLPRKKELPAQLSGGRDTVAVRIPSHPVALALLKAAKIPIAAPSANPSGYISPTTAEHVEGMLNVEIVLDGGPCKVGIESTVVSLCSTPPLLLRPGFITVEQLSEALGTEVKIIDSINDSEALLSPGMLKHHYSPKTPLILWPSTKVPEGDAAWVTFSGTTPSFKAKTLRVLSLSGNLEEAGQNLFATLHELDNGAYKAIVVESCPDTGIGKAIMDRLRRAAENK